MTDAGSEPAVEQEIEQEEEAVEQNGHTPAPPAGQVQVKVTKETTVLEPASQYAQQPPPSRPVMRSRQAVRSQTQNLSARDMLDEYITRPESDNWEISVSRVLPTTKIVNGQHVPLPVTNLLNVSMMSLDALRSETQKAWGGGEYRAVILYRDNHEYVSGCKAVLFSIPLDSCEPKLKKYEMEEELPAPKIRNSAALEDNSHDNDLQEMEKEKRRQIVQDQLDALEYRRMEKKIKFAQMQKALNDIEGTGKKEESGTSAQIEALRRELKEQADRFERTLKDEREASEKRLRDERESSERKSKDERETLERRLKEDREAAERKSKMELEAAEKKNKEQQEQFDKRLREERETHEKKSREDRDAFMKKIDELTNEIKSIKDAPKQDGQKDLMMFFADQQTKMVSALAPRNDGGIQLAEIMKVGMDNIKSVNELAIKANVRENSGEKELFKTIITSVLGRDRGESSTETALKFMQIGQNQTKQMFEMMQGFQQQQQQGDDEEGYNPNIGLLGNMGKLLYVGVKSFVKAAETNPQMAGALMKIFHRADPTEDQMLQYARRMEMQQQGRVVGVQPALPTIQPTSANVPMAPQQPVMHPQGAVITPAPATQPVSAQPPMAPHPQQPVAQQPQGVQRTQVEVATELSGEIEGIDAAAPAPGPGPVNAPLQQQVVEEDEEEEEEGDEEEAQAQAEAMSTPETRLMFYVSQAMQEAIGDVVDKREEHGWPVTAKAYWNGEFKKQFAIQPDNHHRLGLIAEACDSKTWDDLNAKLKENSEAGGDQLVRFDTALTKLTLLIQQGA